MAVRQRSMDLYENARCRNGDDVALVRPMSVRGQVHGG